MDDHRLEAASPSSKSTKEADAHLRYVWNTLMFFACESSYTTGERTGGVLQGCPRNPPPTPAEMACYGRMALASLCRHLGREPEDWMESGVCCPPAPAEHPGQPFTDAALASSSIKEDGGGGEQ